MFCYCNVDAVSAIIVQTGCVQLCRYTLSQSTISACPFLFLFVEVLLFIVVDITTYNTSIHDDGANGEYGTDKSI